MTLMDILDETLVKLQIFYDFMRNDVKAATVKASVFTHYKLCSKLYNVNVDARDISYES